MLKKALILSLFLNVLLSGCSSNSLYHKVLHVPDWILSPDIKDGMALSRCVTWSGDYANNKAAAAQLAKQATQTKLLTNVQGIYSDQLSDLDKQLVNETADRGRTIRVDFADLDNEEQLCTLWYVGDDKLKDLLITVASNHQVEKPDLEVQLAKLKSN